MNKIDTPQPPPQVNARSTSAPQARSGTFASRLTPTGSSATAPAAEPEATLAGDVVASAVRDANAEAITSETNQAMTREAWVGADRLDHRQSADLVEAFKDNPFGSPDPHQAESIAALMSQADPGTLNARMLRLQIRMQREASQFMFASNNAKSDHDGKKEILNNVK